MVETDWREILSYSQRELMQADKEKLCESLCWMEADDIELNFTDLKTLFRLSQDILKHKSEQVNNLLGQLETSQRKSGKGKAVYAESPTRSTESVLETIAHQEEMIKANKEILEQLYTDIAELEGRKSKLEADKDNVDSESSRDPLSEMDAVAQLEKEVALKNRHIRKLLGDVKNLESENMKLKDKTSVLKDKLTEATQLIENLTEQLYGLNNESIRLKEILGKSEQAKAELSMEIESLRKELLEKDTTKEKIYEDIKAKAIHWKNIARSKNAEIKALSSENQILKENLVQVSQVSQPEVLRNTVEELKIKELQDKLSEASDEIVESANLISRLRGENRELKKVVGETPDISVSENKNESDESKERQLINKLKRQINNLTTELQGAEEMMINREKELTEITAQLQLVKSDDGIRRLIAGLKNKKRRLKSKDEGIKTLVQEVNHLNELVSDLQLENEAMRLKLNLPGNEKIPIDGIVSKYRNIEEQTVEANKKLHKLENKLVNLELENRNLKHKTLQLTKVLVQLGNQDKVEDIMRGRDFEEDIMPLDGGGESTAIVAKMSRDIRDKYETKSEKNKSEAEMQAIIDENEGLRRGLKEILEFLKDNSTSSSGILSLQCPSLESILHSMEARHAAGWFAPHMTAVMELKAALGGKHALITALHEARKETFDVMSQLSKESQKSQELERKINDFETQIKVIKEKEESTLQFEIGAGEFGTWMSGQDWDKIDIENKVQLENLIVAGNIAHEEQLKQALCYFHAKFKELFDRMSSLTVQASDDQNKWFIQEEEYKAQIENLKAQLFQEDDTSEVSPGIVKDEPNVSALQRKCLYLEESYKSIRTLNENIKNECLESKKNTMVMSCNYEAKIQKLVVSVVNLTDKLRSSISIDLFFKQNEMFNQIILKYRKLVDDNIKRNNTSTSLLKRLEADRVEILSLYREEFLRDEPKTEEINLNNILSKVEQSVLTSQLQQVCTELQTKTKQIEKLEQEIIKLQEYEIKLIDKNLASATKEDVKLIEEQLEKLTDANAMLKERCQHVESQLDIALLQLQDAQHEQMSCDMEVNLLRHQILDLQSTGDNKAIISRLSGEVLVAHLQATENHKKMERLHAELMKEKQLRAETEDMLEARQKIFDVYCFRYEFKFRYMYEVMQVLRTQYQGSIPLFSIEQYLDNVEELSRKNYDVDEKLDEIEDLRTSLMTKHSVYNQILDVSKAKCLEDGDSCPHKLQNIINEGIYSRELEHCKNKLETMEKSHKDLLKRCNTLEKTLVLVNQGFEKTPLDDILERRNSVPQEEALNMEVEDLESDDDQDSIRTVTLHKPQVLKLSKQNIDMTKLRKEDHIEDLIGSPIRTLHQSQPELVNVFVQTSSDETTENKKKYKSVATEISEDMKTLHQNIDSLKNDIDKKNIELNEVSEVAHQRAEEIMQIHAENNHLKSTISRLQDEIGHKHNLNQSLQSFVNELKIQVEEYKKIHTLKKSKAITATDEGKMSLFTAMKKLESDKNKIASEYTELLDREREEYAKSVRELNEQIMELRSELDKRSGSDYHLKVEAHKEVVNKYTVDKVDLENKCFKLEAELENCNAELATYKTELNRWKDLAAERLSKMEQLNAQLQERHCQEVESYKAENDHWLHQLNETQKEHMELRSRLSEQKAAFIKQLSEKDGHIEQLRNIVHALKTQIMSMQTMMSVTDPSFDLSAIVEVEECSDQSPGSEQLELKYESTVDFNDDSLKTPAASSSAIWQEPAIERLRREKQLISKQNTLLRRQIKALAARERRARLDANNLRNQVYRISTSSSRAGSTAETAALHNKIASLQAQLLTVRRDTHSNVALWDKWKRAQQAAERWQARFEEKCQEVKRLESSLQLTKSSVARLEKEKRLLLTRLSEAKDEKLLAIEKLEAEPPQRDRHSDSFVRRDVREESLYSEPEVSTRALMQRIEAQQRRIAALETAEKGNEYLVSEYERRLAEVTSLKGQVLKLESTLLECQIRTPLKAKQHSQEDMDYWKNYCEMLKEENVQLNQRLTSLEMETVPTSVSQHRVNDLEQTVLTLRGLVSKLQAEQKSSHSGILRRTDSRPNIERGVSDKSRNQLESCRIEIANLRRSIHEKDSLLERSKEMLRIAAEREDHLLRENAALRRELNELMTSKRGVRSA